MDLTLEGVHCRPATAEDVPALVWLTQLFAEYKHEPHGMKIGEKEFLRDGFGEEKFFHVIVAELKPSVPLPPHSPAVNSTELKGEELPSQKLKKNERLLGHALYFFNYSTWEGRVLYLEDLYVRKEFRSKGIGTQLMRECAKVAVAKDCKRMLWQVLDWNTKASDFYERLGGKILPEWLTVCMVGEKLEKFAAGEQQTPNDQNHC